MQNTRVESHVEKNDYIVYSHAINFILFPTHEGYPKELKKTTRSFSKSAWGLLWAEAARPRGLLIGTLHQRGEEVGGLGPFGESVYVAMVSFESDFQWSVAAWE